MQTMENANQIIYHYDSRGRYPASILCGLVCLVELLGLNSICTFCKCLDDVRAFGLGLSCLLPEMQDFWETIQMHSG